jgi:hypothetical protein
MISDVSTEAVTFRSLVIHIRLPKIDCRSCNSNTDPFCSVHQHRHILDWVFFFAFFSLDFFFLFTLLCFPCASRSKAMMIVDLIQNAIRKSTIYLTSTIFFFSLSTRHFSFEKNFDDLIDLQESWILLFFYCRLIYVNNIEESCSLWKAS